MKAKLIIKVIFMSAALLGIIGLMKNLKSPGTLSNPNSPGTILLGVTPEPITAKIIIGSGLEGASSPAKENKGNH